MAHTAGKPLHVNYRFMLDHAEALRPERGDLLDFGCGAGHLVQAALTRGWQARGVEYFGAGSGTSIEKELQEKGLLGAQVLAYDGRTLPFDDEAFDVVVSNQVFEHVPDLPTALREIRRVLRRGGMLINTSRGGLVDTRAAIDALKSGHLGSLAIDVYEEEADLFFEDLSGTVLRDDVFARLLTFPNVVITAHQAFLTTEALDAIAATTLASVTAFEAGEPLKNQVRPPSAAAVR